MHCTLVSTDTRHTEVLYILGTVTSLDERRAARLVIRAVVPGPNPLSFRESIRDARKMIWRPLRSILILFGMALACAWYLEWLDKGKMSLAPFLVFAFFFGYGFIPEYRMHRRAKRELVAAYEQELRDYVTQLSGDSWYAMPHILIPLTKRGGPAGYLVLDAGRVDIWIQPGNAFRGICRRRSSDDSYEPARSGRVTTDFNEAVRLCS